MESVQSDRFKDFPVERLQDVCESRRVNHSLLKTLAFEISAILLEGGQSKISP